MAIFNSYVKLPEGMDPVFLEIPMFDRSIPIVRTINSSAVSCENSTGLVEGKNVKKETPICHGKIEKIDGFRLSNPHFPKVKTPMFR